MITWLYTVYNNQITYVNIIMKNIVLRFYVDIFIKARVFLVKDAPKSMS